MNEVQNQTELNFVGAELTEQEKTVIRLIHAEQKAFEVEKELKRLQAMKKQIDAEIEADKELLRPFIGQTIKGFKITTKAGDSLIMADGAIIPEQYKRTKVEPDKIGLKKAIQAGENFDGFWIETKQHIQVSCLI